MAVHPEITLQNIIQSLQPKVTPERRDDLAGRIFFTVTRPFTPVFQSIVERVSHH